MKLPRAHHLSLQELAGQLILPELTVEFLNRRSGELAELLRQMELLQPAGLILRGNHPVDIRLRIEQIQQVVRFPLLLIARPETGLQPAIPHTTLLPHFAAWGIVQDEDLVSEAARVVAREARAVGLNTLFVPPLNPLPSATGENELNSLSLQQEHVWSLSTHIIRAVQQEGLLAIPYLLSTERNTPFPKDFSGLPLAEVHAFHYRYIATNLSEAQEASPSLPVRNWQQHGFRGLVITAVPFLLEEPADDTPLREALKAGMGPFTDSAHLTSSDSRRVYQRQEAATVFRATSFRNRLVKLLQQDETAYRAACRTVDTLFRIKKELHRHQPQLPHFKRIYKILQQPAHQNVARKLTAGAVRLLHRKSHFRFQPAAYQRIHHIPLTNPDISPAPFATLMQRLADTNRSITTVSFDNLPEPETIRSPLPDLVIVSLHHTFEFRQRCGLSRETLNRLLQSYLNASVPVVLLLFGTPFQLRLFDFWKEVHAALVFFTDVPAAQHLAFDFIRGSIDLPPELPEVWQSAISRQ